ncbi:MAG: right-handed parallel beta-helix repeat-containing protein, partial [bacterium]
NVHRVFKVLNNSSCNFTYRLVDDDRAAMEMFVNNFSGINLKQIVLSDSLILTGRYRLYEDANFNGKLDKSDPLLQEQMAEHGRLQFNFNKQLLPELKQGVESINERHWEYFEPVGKRCRFFLVGKLTPEKRHPLLWNPPAMAVVAENAVSGHQIPSAFIDQDNPLPENYIGITAFDNSDVFNLDAIDLPLAEFVKKHPEFKVSKSQTGAVELRGKVTLDETVIVPRSVMLIIQPGADITLKPDVSLLCYGGLTSAGTAEHPISIHGDGSGEPFGVVAVVRPPKKVEVSYTRFRDGGQAQINGILFTGGLAVHEGDLDLIQSQFTNMQSEDGVNLKNGRLIMKNCLFANNASDGIDVDFGEGEVVGNKFVNNVGDGLDLSGTKLTIAHNWFEKMADKGVSVGEDSHPILINNLFRDCEIGISTKDLSLAKIAHCTFVNNKLAVEAKRKKPMFGPGSGEIVNSVFAGNQTILREDYFSRGRVRISHSVADESVEWPASKTTDVRFLAPQENNYLIDPVNLMGNGFSLAQPDWLKSNVNGYYIEQPGIYSIFE